MRKVAAIYARQSVTTAGDKDVSIQDQLERCRALPAVAACDAVEEYVDRNISGQTADRPAFQKLLARLQSGEIAVVAAYDGYRIRRENEIGAKFMNMLIAAGGIDLAMGDGSHYDTTPDGEFRWGLDGLIGRKQARESGIRLSNAHQRQREHGHITGMAPYGYRYVDRKPGEKWPEVVPDDETAPVLQRIFKTYADGEASAKQIAEMLHREKVPAPISNRNKNRADRSWSGDVIGGMLANRRYLAEPPAKWKPLVERDVFDRVQARLASKAQGKAKGQRSCIFLGLLYCQECGRRLSPTYFPQGVYYQCGSKNSLTPCALARESVKESDVRGQVEAVFADFLNGIPAATPAAVVETNEIKIARVRKQLERVGDRYETEGTMTREAYTAKVAELKAQIKALEEQPVKAVDPRELLTLGQQWRKGDAAERNTVLKAMWERIEVGLEEPTEDERMAGEVTRRDGQMARVVKLLARADRASQAHALVSAALQYVRQGEPVLFDSDGVPVPRDGGPGSTLGRRGWMGIDPTQDASAAPRKRF